MTAGGPTSINAYRKLNTPKGEVGFGLNDVCTEDLFSSVLGRSFLVWIRKQDDNEDLDLESVQSTCQTYSIFMTPCGNTVTFCERSALWSVVSSGVDNPEAIMCMKNIIYGLWISKTLSQRRCPFLSLARILFLWLNSWWRTLQQSIIFPCRQVVTNPGPWA